MKLNYNPYTKKKKEQIDFQIFNDFQEGLRKDLDKKEQDIKVATQSAAMIGTQGGTVS